MTLRTVDVLLRQATGGSWSSDALALPGARVASVLGPGGFAVPYDVRDGTIVVDASVAGAPLVGRIELTEDLVQASELERAKVVLEREKVAAEERSGRRTLWVSLATAVLSAAATIAVAWLSHAGAPAPSPAAPQAYRDLVECRESLSRLTTLMGLQQETIATLRDAVSRHVATCRERLDVAIAAAPP